MLSKPLSHLTEPTTLRQRALAAGLDPSYWYAVAWERDLPPGKVTEVKFQGTSVALFRTRAGELRAIENRCAHRQVKLSHGFVDDCNLRCIYHGWSYDGDGRLVGIPHELFGKPSPSVELKSYPLQVKHGLVWLFFGDRSLMASRPIPEIPELSSGWTALPIDFVWRAHPTMVVNNVMDSTHVGTLHNRRLRTRSFRYGPVTRCEASGDRVIVSHTIEMDPTAVLTRIGNPIKVGTQDACYDYPHLWISVGGVYKLWNFLLPIDERTTRIFMYSCAERMRIPFTPFMAPKLLDRAVVWLARNLLVKTLFDEDGWSTELEQEGYEAHGHLPAIDPHPAPRLCYQLTVRKWEEHLARGAGAPTPKRTLGTVGPESP